MATPPSTTAAESAIPAGAGTVHRTRQGGPGPSCANPACEAPPWYCDHVVPSCARATPTSASTSAAIAPAATNAARIGLRGDDMANRWSLLVGGGTSYPREPGATRSSGSQRYQADQVLHAERRQDPERVDIQTVDLHAQMQMGDRGSGMPGSGRADLLSARDDVAAADRGGREPGVGALHSGAMVDRHEQLAAHATRERHRPGLRGKDGCPERDGDVDPSVAGTERRRRRIERAYHRPGDRPGPGPTREPRPR